MLSAESHEPFHIQFARDLCRMTRFVDTETRNHDVYALFESDPALLNLPVTDDGAIVGLINRDRFMRFMAGHLRWELYSKKRCTKIMDEDPLVVTPDTPIRELASGLLNPDEPHRLSDGFIVAEGGKLKGTGLTSDVLAAILILERQASDELRRHRDHLASMVEIRTRDLLTAQRNEEKQRIENSLAKTVIDRMMMRHGLKDAPLAYWFHPAESFSGDIIAASRSPSGVVNVMLADATGHGLSPAITVLPVLTLFYRLVEQAYPLEVIAYELNRELLQTMPAERFVAASLVAIDSRRNSAMIWQGGMPPILHLDAQGRTIQRYTSEHLALGIVDFEAHQSLLRNLPCKPGEQLVLFSDGLLEARNLAGTEFGLKQIEKSVLRTRSRSQIDHLQHVVNLHLEGLLPHDDVSVAIIDC